MWSEASMPQSPLTLQITRHPHHVFGFNLIHADQLVFQNVQVQLPEHTYGSLHKSLRDLTGRRTAAEPDLFRKLGKLLFRLVLPPEIQSYLKAHTGPLVFATDELSLPWELLHDPDDFLCLRRPFCRQPKLNDVVHDLGLAPRLPGRDEAGDHVLIIADTQGDLPSAVSEARELEELFRNQGVPCETLIGPKDCTFLNILSRLEQPYRIIHYCGHAREVPIKDTTTGAIPLLDELLMADSFRKLLTGEPIVFLNACYGHPVRPDTSGECGGSQYAGAEIVRSLSQAFTVGSNRGRARAIVASMWWTEDTVASGLATRFYRGVFAGLPLGEALRSARENAACEYADPALWSTYVLFGKPNLTWSFAPPAPTPQAAAPLTGHSPSSIPAAQSADEKSGGKTAGPRGTDADVPAVAGPTTSITISLEEAGPRGATSRPPVTSESQHKALPAGAAADNESTDETDGAGSKNPDMSSPEVPEMAWSDEVRVALVGSMAAMSQMHWSTFSTLHLVLGLTYVERGHLSQALRWRRLDPDTFRRQLREKLANTDDQGARSDIKISENVTGIFLHARRLARENGDAEATERHLLFALLKRPQCSAIRILNLVGVDLQRLEQSLSLSSRGIQNSGKLSAEVGASGSYDPVEPVNNTTDEVPPSATSISVSLQNWESFPTPPHAGADMPASPKLLASVADITSTDGNLDRRLFEAECLAALETTVVLAVTTCWSDIRSPHLFLAMLLREQGPLAQQFSRVGQLRPAELVQTLLRGLRGTADSSVALPRLHREFLSESALVVLRGGWRLAVRRGAARIAERDLLEAQLGDEENIITQYLRSAGIEPRRLLWPLPSAPIRDLSHPAQEGDLTR